MINETPWDVWTLCAAGDYIMLPLLVMLLIVIYVFAERAYFICNAARYNGKLLERIKDYVHDNELESADNLCRQESTASARTLQKGLGLLGHPMCDIYDAMTLTATMEAARLKKLTGWLPFVAAAAPLAGLLGALLGVLQTVSANADIAENAQALFTPLVTLVAGVIVGIVAICCHYYTQAMLNKVQITLNTVIARFIAILNEPSV